MDINIQHLSFKELKAFFCAGMAQGWASGAEGIASAEFPNHNHYRYSDSAGGLLLVDEYGVGETQSFGTTRIFNGEGEGAKLIWVMSYWGGYQKTAIPFLKQTLMMTYSQGEFYGGRGFKSWNIGNMYYFNDHEGDFFVGRGRERIEEHVSGGSKYLLGQHEYQWMTIS